MGENYILIKEAQDILGVSAPKISRLVKDGSLQVYTYPLDKRKKLVLKDEVEKLKRPVKSEG